MIPKIIHIVWIGDDSKRPDEFIRSWPEMNPDYEVVLWGNADLENREWYTKRVIDQWLQRELCGAADVMRWEILYRYGGIAVDADSICVRPLEDWLLEPDIFAVWENEIARPGLICTGALGSIKRHPLLATIIQEIMDDPDLMSKRAWEKVGPGRITDVVRKHAYSSLTVYPSHFFIPTHFTGVQFHGTSHVFARQAWASTHEKYDTLETKDAK